MNSHAFLCFVVFPDRRVHTSCAGRTSSAKLASRSSNAAAAAEANEIYRKPDAIVVALNADVITALPGESSHGGAK
jgi:hypothetical protein